MGENRNQINPTISDVTERLREDIRRTEANISETLHSIEHRFTPRHIRNQVKANIRHYALVGLVKTNDALRQRNIQAAVAGAGAALMYILRNSKSHGKKTADIAGKGSAVIDALPEKIKHDPVKGVKQYLTVGRIALAVASALGIYFRGKGERAMHIRHLRHTPARTHGGASGTMHGNVME